MSATAPTAAGKAPGRPAAHPEKMVRAGLRAAMRIFAAWGLDDAAASTLLGGVGLSTLRRWRRDLEAGRDVKIDVRRDLTDRLSLILGIYKALQILFPSTAQADAWVSRTNSNPVFGGRSALDVMLNGGMDDLYRVRRFLDAQRG